MRVFDTICNMLHCANRGSRSLPPRGGRLRLGVASRVPAASTPHPNPPPNGGRETIGAFGLALLLLFLWTVSVNAGVHYSGETWNELPVRWRGYLLDQQSLRSLAVPGSATRPGTPLRAAYEAERDRLESLDKTRTLSADEAADLGAIHIRLGEPEKAVTVLRSAHRTSPNHFAIAANLGSAYQLAGDLRQAVTSLEVANELAPAKWKGAEQLHLKLARQRLRGPKATGLDDLFDANAKPSEASLALCQTLGLWLPADGRLLWQLGELAHATGDTATAANILDGCVSEFGMSDSVLRDHRAKYKDAPPLSHEKHQATVNFRSSRALVRKIESLKLPEVKPNGLNPLPWQLLGMTTIEQPFRPVFADHLKQLDGKRVVMTGYIQPTGDGTDQNELLLIEFQIGCWFCDKPDTTSIMIVRPAPGKPLEMTRDAVRVEGVLRVNAADPESPLYVIQDARVGAPD